MKKKLGRPKLKAKERKEIVPMRLSAIELKVLKAAAKDQPLTTWMRETLLSSAGVKELAKVGLDSLLDQAHKTGGATLRVNPIKPTAPTRSLAPRAVESP